MSYDLLNSFKNFPFLPPYSLAERLRINLTTFSAGRESNLQ